MFRTSHLYCWLYVGLLLWICLLHTQPGDWQQYFRLTGHALLQLSPVLFFSWNWPQRRWPFRALTFLVLLPATTALCLSLPANISATWEIACSAPLLELVFLLNTFYYQRLRHIRQVQRISLENALFIVLVIIAVLLAAMAVSSIGDPRFMRGNEQLIGVLILPGKVLAHPGLFLSYATQFLLMYLCGYLFFILNSRLLVPVILKQHGIALYILCALGLIALLSPPLSLLLTSLPLNTAFGKIFPDNPFNLETPVAAIFILLISLPVILAIQYARQHHRILLLEKEKARTELDLLTQQLNPHFFFNTLNNLYALSMQRSDQTPESILQLSDLMRYAIYKGREPLVPVRDEVKYLQDYIQLQQIRQRNVADIQMNVQLADDTPDVAPMLLIVLVENAFKHGIENAETPGFLHLHIQADAQRLYCCCENTVETPAAGPAGIGLANLRKRLELRYPGQHLLHTELKNHTFKAELELRFS